VSCTLAFGFGPFCHPVVLQVLHCRGKILGYHLMLNTGMLEDSIVLLTKYKNDEEKRAKRETCKYASSHVCTSPLELRKAMLARLDKNSSRAEALRDFRWDGCHAVASRTRWDPRLRSQVSDKLWLVTSAQLNPLVQRPVLASMFFVLV